MQGFQAMHKSKPTKWVIKVFVLSDATNGCISQLQIHTGKNVESGHVDAGLCSRVLLDFMSGIFTHRQLLHRSCSIQGFVWLGHQLLETVRTRFPEVLKKMKRWKSTKRILWVPFMWSTLGCCMIWQKIFLFCIHLPQGWTRWRHNTMACSHA